MLSEGGDVSHKRWISVSISAAIFFILIWVTVKYKDLTMDALHSSMIFVAVMSGVATVAQIVSLVKGTPLPTETKKDETTS